MNTVFFSISTMSENEEKVKARTAELEEDFTDKKLLKLCVEMGLEATGTKRDKAGRIAQAEMQNHRSRDTHEDEKVMEGMRNAFSSTPAGGEEPHQKTSFKVVADTFAKFRGGDDQNVYAWLSRFDDLCVSGGWNDLEKVSYLKKSLDPAVLALVEDTPNNYEATKDALAREFGESCKPANIIRRITERKKKRGETTIEYVTEMKKYGRLAGLDDGIIARFIVDGLDMNPLAKISLYTHTDLTTLRTAIDEVEWHLQKFERQQPPVQITRTRSDRCVNCGAREHSTSDCPLMSLGKKCFNCSQHGHIAAQCPAK